MKLSKKVRYAVRAMVDLALNAGKGPVSLKGISIREGISARYLEQLFMQLRRGGLIKSIRGPRGGYLLNKPPKKITIGEIVRCVESSFDPVHYLEEGVDVGSSKKEESLTRELWGELGKKITDFLDNYTLFDLKERVSEKFEIPI